MIALLLREVKIVNRIIIGGLLLLQVGYASALSPELVIKFDLERQWPLIRLKIDDAPATLILDTGGGSMLALRPSWPNPPVDKDSKSRRLEFAAGHSLELLSTVWKKSPAPNGIDGYLGYGFFRQYNIVIDYASAEFRLYRIGDEHLECSSKPESISNLGSLEYLKIEREGKPLLLGLDTGANQNILTTSSGSAVPGDSPASRGKTTLGDRELDLGKFRRVSLQIPVIDGFLGYDFFAKHRVCINPVARTISVDQFSQAR